MVIELFVQQKEIMRKSWECLTVGRGEVDPDVYHVLNKLNQLDFVYTHMSCSGTPRDHDGEYHPLPEGCYEAKACDAWVMMSVDISDPRFQSFKRGLEEICGVELNELGPKKRGFIPECIKKMMIQLSIPNEPAKQDPVYLANLWNDVYRVVDYCKKMDPIKERLKNEKRSYRQRV